MSLLWVGASQHESREEPGYVKVFQFEADSWVPLGHNPLVDDEAVSQFGEAVQLSSDGMILAVSVRRDRFCESIQVSQGE